MSVPYGQDYDEPDLPDPDGAMPEPEPEADPHRDELHRSHRKSFCVSMPGVGTSS